MPLMLLAKGSKRMPPWEKAKGAWKGCQKGVADNSEFAAERWINNLGNVMQKTFVFVLAWAVMCVEGPRKLK